MTKQYQLVLIRLATVIAFVAAAVIGTYQLVYAWYGGVHKNPNCYGTTISATPEDPYVDPKGIKWHPDPSKATGLGFFPWVNGVANGTVTITWVSEKDGSEHPEPFSWNDVKPGTCTDPTKVPTTAVPSSTPIPSNTPEPTITNTQPPTLTNQPSPTQTLMATATIEASTTPPADPTGTATPFPTQPPCKDEDACGGKGKIALNFQPPDKTNPDYCPHASGTARVVTGGFDGKVYLIVHYPADKCWTGKLPIEVPFTVSADKTQLAVYWIPDDGGAIIELVFVDHSNAWMSALLENTLEIDWP